jgi:hypothetical protein
MKVFLFTGFLLLATCSILCSFAVGDHSVVRAMDSTARANFVETTATPTPTPSSEPIPPLAPAPVPTVTPWPEVVLTPETIPQESRVKEPDLTTWLDHAFGSPDADCDGILNKDDNCVLKFNPDQADKDRNGIGDVCDGDMGEKLDIRCDLDQDGKFDREDNCIAVCNPDQKDENKNGIGDACESASGWYTGQTSPCKKPKTNPPRKSLTKKSPKQKRACGKRLRRKFR